jgi:general stress protein 26
MKLIQAIPMPKQVTEDEVNRFLQSKLNMQLATIDDEGYPYIQPVWFYFDQASGKIMTGTQKGTKKVNNIRRNPDKIYFSIDDENFPYKGVKGKGSGSISEDIKRNLSVIEKINMKYLGTLEHPLAKMLMDNARNGTEVVIEITPKYFSAWDFGKAQ